MDTKTNLGFALADWDEYARCYDALRALAPYQELINTVCAAISPKDGDTVLDAGCGTGNLLQALSAVCEEPELYGIDASSAMLARARKKCAGMPVLFSNASLNAKLPFADSFFDSIGSVNVLYALDDPEAVLHELHRVLKPRGKLVLVTPKKGYDNGIVLKCHAKSPKSNVYWSLAHASKERAVDLIREAVQDEQSAGQMVFVAEHNREIARTARFHFFTQHELGVSVARAGFTDVTTAPIYANQGICLTARKGD